MTSSSTIQHRRRALSGSPSVFSDSVIKDDGSPQPILLAATVAILTVASAIPATASGLTLVACIFMLIIGLPHGMFDYLTLRKLSRNSRIYHAALIAVYCGVAGIVWQIWQSAPFLSLAVFITIAIIHFSEDWLAEKSRLGAAAMAVSMIALPAIVYPDQLSTLFVLIGGTEAGIISDYLRLVAPVFGLVALAHIIIDLGSNAADRAYRNAILLLATLILPPGIGFAVYFCLYHSPIHFVEGRKTLMAEHGIPRHFFLLMSLASAAAVTCILIAQPLAAMDTKLIATSFQTLSILTVPHMLLAFFGVQKVELSDEKTIE